MATSEPFLSVSWHLVASLRLRLQTHVEIARHRAYGRIFYVVRNPATGRTYKFSPSVYRLLGLFDGRTVAEAWSVVADQLDEDAPTQDQTIQLLAQLHEADLIQGDSIPDAVELIERRRRMRRRLWMQSFANPLAIRLRLWDPDNFLQRTLPWVRPLTGPFGLLLWVSAVVPALVLAGEHWTELTGGLVDRLLATKNLLLVALIFPVVKALHELGHGYAVKAGGGEVHEMGLMFLVLMPVPYVDATAANTFRSKWRRVGVGAAGILVETFLAAVMMLVWVQVEPGMVRAVAFNTMLIAGISTVLLNGNPLLRFDGYFILCDLISMPNLAIRAAGYWGWLIQRYAFGQRAAPPAATKTECILMLLYAPSSAVYRVVITLTIALLIARRFLLIGVLMAIWGVAVTLVWPLCRWILHVIASPALAHVRGRAFGMTIGFAAAFIGLIGFVPIPVHTVAEGVIWIPETSLVRAGSDGFVRELLVQPGEVVVAGTLLLTTNDPDLTSEVRVDRARVAVIEARLLIERVTDSVQVGISRRELDLERSRLAQALERAAALELRSPVSGTFLIPRAEDQPGQYHRRGELIGYVASAGATVARVVVRQEDVGLVRQRLRGVEVRLADDLAQVWPATLVREVPAASHEFPSPALMMEGGGSEPADMRDPRHAKALSRLFQFDIALPPEAARAAWGGRVWVRFYHGTEPLAAQWWRRLRQLLLSRFDA
jgi:putative peptide zinc metalloprotease protein